MFLMSPEILICVAGMLSAATFTTIDPLPMPPVVEVPWAVMDARFGRGFMSLYHAGEGLVYVKESVWTSQLGAHEYAWHLLWEHGVMRPSGPDWPDVPVATPELIDLVGKVGYICG